VRGSARIERDLTQLAGAIAEAAGKALAPSDYRTLIMMGGYGRGEGGVDRRSGAERPHNNIDLLLVTTGLGGRDAELKRRLEGAIAPLAAQAGIGIDVGTVPHLRLAWAPCRIIWYDTRFGHKTLAGDATYFRNLERFSADRILASDARDLLVNRGTLLLLNELILEHGRPGPEQEQALVRHAVKAIIGYGDALLYFLGGYHWSYLVKRNRLVAHPAVPDRFRRLYSRACDYRLEPSAGGFAEVADPGWLGMLRTELSAVHGMCEAARLGRDTLEWPDYPDAALSRITRDALRSPVDLARGARRALRHIAGQRTSETGAPISLRFASARDRLALAFPAVAYHLDDGPAVEAARMALGAPDGHHASLRQAFLAEWGHSGDVNFGSAAARLGLEPPSSQEAA
jgi:hypothetical protein